MEDSSNLFRLGDGAIQASYYTSRMILTAKALSYKNPTEEEVKYAINRDLLH